MAKKPIFFERLIFFILLIMTNSSTYNKHSEADIKYLLQKKKDDIG